MGHGEHPDGEEVDQQRYDPDREQRGGQGNGARPQSRDLPVDGAAGAPTNTGG